MRSIEDIGSWDTSQVTDMRLMFHTRLRSTKILEIGTRPK